MGQLITQQVIDALCDAGIPAAAACPGAAAPALTQVVAAVQMYRVCPGERTATVQADLFCPTAMGGSICEEKALLATELLHNMGAQCTQEECTFVGSMQAFRVTVNAVFPGTLKQGIWTADTPYLQNVYLKGQILHVESFLAERVPDEETGKLGTGWKFRLQEFYTAEEPLDVPDGGFVMSLYRGPWNEHFYECNLTSCQRIAVPGGLRIIREGTAAYRKIGAA